MLLLTSASDILRITTTASVGIDVHASWVDNLSGAITPGRTNTAYAGTGTQTIVAAPAGSTQRTVQMMSLRNKHASTQSDLTIEHYDGTTAITLFKCTLAASE